MPGFEGGSDRGQKSECWAEIKKCDSVCKRVHAYQSPEPALFTVDVPALDGGQRHRVGVLRRDGDKEENIFESQGAERRTNEPIQHCTSLTEDMKPPPTMAQHSQQPQSHAARQHGEQRNQQPVHKPRTQCGAGSKQRRWESGRGRRG